MPWNATKRRVELLLLGTEFFGLFLTLNQLGSLRLVSQSRPRPWLSFGESRSQNKHLAVTSPHL